MWWSGGGLWWGRRRTGGEAVRGEVRKAVVEEVAHPEIACIVFQFIQPF